MTSVQKNRRRHGATTIELAITCPIAFFLILATIVAGIGVFRYQQVASLAREGARWASVHGAEYGLETGQSAATPQDVFTSAIQPMAVALDPTQLSYAVTWDSSNEPLTVHNDYEQPRGNTVSVRVNYTWFPEMYLVGPFTLTSTSTAQMVY